jgi:hypothetical protein
MRVLPRLNRLLTFALTALALTGAWRALRRRDHLRVAGELASLRRLSKRRRA